MFEREYRELSVVPRWAIVRTIQKQNVAEHTFYVTLYSGQIADLVEWDGPRGVLLDYALRHDLEEMYMSDIPGPSKRAMVPSVNVCGEEGYFNPRDAYELHTEVQNFKRFGEDYDKRKFRARNDTHPEHKLLGEIKAIVKVADLIDECCFLSIDQQLGNRGIVNVFESSFQRLRDAINVLTDDGMKRNILLTAVNDAIYHHRNAQSIIPKG